MSRIKLHNDGVNEIVFKPSTKKVVIGIDIHSWHKAKYISFKATTQEEALKIGKQYVNKKSQLKIA